MLAMWTYIQTDNPVTARYVASLEPVRPSDVALSDIIQSLRSGPETETLDDWNSIRSLIDSLDDIYRDGSGNLVFHGEGRYSIAWPVRTPVQVTSGSIEGSGGDVFVCGDVPRGIVPLPLASDEDTGFGWGYTGHGPGALYRALIRVALGDVPRKYDTEFHAAVKGSDKTLYGWIWHGFEWGRPFHVDWQDLARRVDVEMRWRRAYDELRARAMEEEERRHP